MINVLIKTESHYTVNRKRIRETVEKILKEKGVKSEVEVSISIIGNRMMKYLNDKYRHIDEITSVLSFPLASSEQSSFVDYPDKILRLGDIVISYPEARDGARQESKLVDDMIDELIKHGIMSLLG